MSERKRTRQLKRAMEHWHRITIYLVIYDVFAVTFAYFGALWLRFDLRVSLIPLMYLEPWMKFAPFYALFCVIVFRWLKLYNSIWRFAS